jgi:hypothetical protein
VRELGDQPAAHDAEAHTFSCDRRCHREIGSLADRQCPYTDQSAVSRYVFSGPQKCLYIGAFRDRSLDWSR